MHVDHHPLLRNTHCQGCQQMCGRLRAVPVISPGSDGHPALPTAPQASQAPRCFRLGERDASHQLRMGHLT